MGAVAAYREILAANAKPGYFFPRAWNWHYFGLGDALRGQRHYGEAAQAYEQAAWTRNVGPELKIRSLLAAGECRDLNGERQLAVKDYQAAIDSGPEHLAGRHGQKAPAQRLYGKADAGGCERWNRPCTVSVCSEMSGVS
jgi:tetratricopeptide (TPR) repeat protein